MNKPLESGVGSFIFGGLRKGIAIVCHTPRNRQGRAIYRCLTRGLDAQIASDFKSIEIAAIRIIAISVAVSFRKIRDGETTIKIKFAFCEGGGPWGQRGESSQNAIFLGKRHDNQNF